MRPMYAQYVDNFGLLPLVSGPVFEQDTAIRCLICCTPMLQGDDSLRALADWMTRRGYRARIAYRNCWDSTQARVLRDTIRAEYNSHYPHELQYVLLVGEAKPPTISMYYDSVPRRHYDGDFAYSLLDGSDLYPDIGLTRLSPLHGTRPDTNDTNAMKASLDGMIGKILRYERNPDTVSGWMTRTCFVANDSWARDSWGYIDSFEPLIRRVWAIHHDYWTPAVQETIMGDYDGDSTVRQTLNSTGVGVLLYAGHGGPDRWYAWTKRGPSNWSNSDIDTLTNLSMTPVVFNMACNCGAIQDPSNHSTCLSEAWLRASGGAVASLGADSTVGHPGAGQCSCLVRALYNRDSLPNGTTCGPVFDIGAIKM